MRLDEHVNTKGWHPMPHLLERIVATAVAAVRSPVVRRDASIAALEADLQAKAMSATDRSERTKAVGDTERQK